MKQLFFLFLFTCKLFSMDVTPDIVPIYKSIRIAQDLRDIEQAMRDSDKFEDIHYFRRMLRKKEDNNNLWLKLHLENKSDLPLIRQLVMRWERANIDVYLVEDKKIVYQDSLNKGEYHCVSDMMMISNENYVELFLHVKVPKPIDDFYYLYIVDPKEAKDLVIFKEKYFHNGFFLGILLTMMLYNFFMYFSMKVKSYLYLALYQFAIIFYISDLRLLAIMLLESYPAFSYWLLKLGASFFISILSILFTKEFLNTKVQMPRLDKALNFSIIILAFFQLHGTMANYAAFLYILYIVAGLYAYYKGNFSALFFTFGFAGSVFFVMGINIVKIFDLSIYLEYQSTIQVLACIEALSLSMAMYLKLKSMVEEKDQAQMEVIAHEKMMLEQSRFATMGEMLASIAHQWKQPLNHLNLILNNLRFAQEVNKLDGLYLQKKTQEAEKQIKYMSSTIEDFSNFFSAKKQEEAFRLKEVCKYALELVESRLKKNNIIVTLNCNDNCEHINYKNELVQVLTVILNNAIDALMINNVKDRKIYIDIACNTIFIEDNAGGIPENILLKIFDPYFSTKDKKFGTGLGLYTAMILVRDLIKGELIAHNVENGARFSIKL